MDLDLEFTDITMIETDGEYDKVKSIMDKEGTPEWMIRTDLYIDSEGGSASFVLSFWHDRRIFIQEYDASGMNQFYDMELIGLSKWARENGWKTPEPSNDILLSNKDFWKHFWDTYIVNCEYFDQHYGKREIDIDG